MVRKNILKVLFLGFFCLVFGIDTSVFCASTPAAVQYLCELGVEFYLAGNYDEALKEFNKVLILDSTNETALKYKNSIIEGVKTTLLPEISPQPQQIEAVPRQVTEPQLTEPQLKEPAVTPVGSRVDAIENAFTKVAKPAERAGPEEQKVVSREDIMEGALRAPRKIAKKEPLMEKEEEEKKPGLKITGETQLSLGISSDDVIWKRANYNLNEEDSRILSEAAYNNRTNTYDPRVYDRLRVNLDTAKEEGFNFHTNITVDPWSFVGKSDKVIVTSPSGDKVEVELKYWSNTRYTVNETAYTLRNGASIALPEIKVVDGKTESAIPVNNTWSQAFTIPQLKIHREYQPLRELWFDYAEPDSFKIRFFPLAYQGQALIFNDPLMLSNHHTWWEESPWLDRWLPGRTNPGVVPEDFTRGMWDDTLSFLARDSDGTRLTALRGASLELMGDNMSLTSTFASPKTLWQDYDNFDNLINATRFNYRLLDNLSLGALYTYRLGLTEHSKRDIDNYVWGFDAGYEPIEGLKLSLEAATSRTHKDLTSPGYTSSSQGNAFFFSLMGAFPRKGLMDLKNGYYDMKPEETDTFFTRYRIYGAHMDSGFDPTLSNYRETRDDSFWSRHIQFKKPFAYFQESLYGPSLNWEDVEPYRIGDGIDIGRNVMGLRLETSAFDRRVDNLFDVRNVHDVNGKFLENAARDEITYKVNDKLTSKALGIYQVFPRTRKGVDPFIFDTNTGIYVNNTAIEDDLNVNLKTGSLGLEYAFTEWLALSGVWEHTNDSTLAYDNWPRGDLSSMSFTSYREYGRVFHREDPFLYQQSLFPLPPYSFYDIWKTGLRFNPFENLELYLDYTRNEFKSAGQIDDNINHIGFEAAYRPNKKFGVYLKYIFSRWNDVNLMLGGASHYYLSHHNVFAEFRYLPTSDDELILQYGESGRSNLSTKYTDPFNLGTPALDTQHIIRTYYRRKF